MVLSERNLKPSFVITHLMTETPIWALGLDSKRVLVATIISFSWLLIFLALFQEPLNHLCTSPPLRFGSASATYKNHFL
jgi:hypothetical protein